MDPRIFIRNAFGRSLIFLTACLSISSCASVGGPALQSRINGLVVAGQPQIAAEKITAKDAHYGSGNYVLYHLDRALILQLTGDFSSSTASLEKAKARDEELYTRSLTNEASTWVLNDNMAPYRAPAYERVLMNVFQAFNYLQMKDLNEALVEARDLDSRFPVVPEAYARDKRRFEDNGFARLLCGILYEAAGTGEDLNDALISYKQALVVYDTYYDGKYVPQVLQENLVRLAEKFNDQDLGAYRARFGGGRGRRIPVNAAVVYSFESAGFSPVKAEEMVPVPVEHDLVTKMAWPRFVPRLSEVQASRLVLKSPSGEILIAPMELGIDVDELAEKDLAARKAMAMAKAIARPALKYLIERNQKDAITKGHGETAGEIFGLFSSLFNFYTERADLRSWQALPGQVRAARIQVPAGVYHVGVEGVNKDGAVVSLEDKGETALDAGRTYFFIGRSLR